MTDHFQTPVLYRSNCSEPRKIIDTFYPFQHPESIEGMIIGNDLDSLLSAAFLKLMFDWDIAGIYDYTKMWYAGDSGFFCSRLLGGKYLAVDLDIYHASIPSIGHHILEVFAGENLPGHHLTLNPNFIRGINLSNFCNKYPLAMIHYLLWLFDRQEIDLESSLLIWLADSAYINAQHHRFRKNVSDWISQYFRSQALARVFRMVELESYEELLVSEVIGRFKDIPICCHSGRIKSCYKKLAGFQCQWDDPNKHHPDLERLLAIICEITGWKAPILPCEFNPIEGERAVAPLSKVLKQYQSLSCFLEKECVFSYVLHYRQTINYSYNFRWN